VFPEAAYRVFVNRTARALVAGAAGLLLVCAVWLAVKTPRSGTVGGRPEVVPAAPVPVARATYVPPAEPSGPDLTSIRARIAQLLDGLPKRSNEALLHFRSGAELEAFLARTGRRTRVLGLNRGLHTVRLGFDRLEDLLADAPAEAQIGANYLVRIPDDRVANEIAVQQGAQPSGAGAVPLVAGSDARDGWGRGVRVAVLDSGVAAHEAFGGRPVAAIDLVGAGVPDGHGTAVASLIAGQTALAPGVAPAADLLSVRVTGADGLSDVFTLADGIQRAADAGAQVINISLGSEGDSPLMRDAVAYAQARGAVIVASAGNEGATRLSYPAAYAGVVSVGAVDANANAMLFSNHAPQLQLAAPGYGVNAAWTGGEYVGFSGTSASAPLVSGAIAAVVSQTGLRPADAAALLVQYANDTGAPGPDPLSGAGIPSVQRVLQRSTPGIVDGAVAGQFLDGSTIVITVQNRGTETLVGTTLAVSAGGAAESFRVDPLAPNTIRSYSVTVDPAALSSGAGVVVQSQLQSPAGSDRSPVNNQLNTQFRRVGP
jgi:hypothetical protein